MKRTFYINEENSKFLEEIKKQGKSQSEAINKALEMYFNADIYDNNELRKKQDWGLAVFRFPLKLLKILQKIKEKSKSRKAVNGFVMLLILQDLDMQNDRQRSKFPFARMVRADYVSKVLERLSK